MGENKNEILEQYRNISGKLKKRFLRKPNVTEASESFASLAKHCESQDLPAYAGICWVAAARCEGSLSNSTEETSYLVNSSRQFLKAEQNDFNLNLKSNVGEYLQAGLTCYAHASSRYQETSAIPVALNLEIVDFLKRIQRPELVENYLEEALNLTQKKSDISLHCYDLLATHFIESGDYFAALETYMEMSKLLQKLPFNGARLEMLLNCEVHCVFLLLLLRPSPQKISPNLSQILEKYTWGDQNDANSKACRMPENMFILLKSVVNTCQSWDTSNLVDLEADFWPYLTKIGKELFRSLVKSYE